MVGTATLTPRREEAANWIWDAAVAAPADLLCGPAPPRRTPTAGLPEPRAARAARTDGATRCPSVLIVDDDESVRELLHELLECDGRLAVAGEACDGLDAVDAVARLRPDAVILDNQMPGMTGLQALPALRHAAPGAVVIMLSGTADGDLERLAAEAGAHRSEERRVG